MIPKAKTDACENAPPANISKMPNKPLLPPAFCAASIARGLIPGKVICAPIR